ncbi:mRNA-capping enzyme-like [Oopsacas minuta]|uniref:mRNA-capping enzyme n=1 Tax=Oopsacas minuta TaxID=111878 RepID=A0AAV7KK69_9METZ|nr:mRNA-capping enzyme-like [Oopsacas minuta]
MDEKQSINLPESWLKCPRKGKLIADKFLPFKTPLCSDFSDLTQEKDRFPPSMLATLKHPLGLVINLTNSDRFYSPKDLTTFGIDFMKIPCEGHKKPPTEEQTRKFIQTCTNHLNREKPKAVGVHCTHGFNRTGFLIVSYLVQEEDWGLSAAVQAFTEARPPGIYKQEYLNELCTRFGEEEGPLIAPERPAWRESDLANDESIPNDHNSFTGNFMEEVPSIHALTDHCTFPKPLDILKKVCQLCSLRNGHNLNFPGSQPVTLDRNRLDNLKEHPYWVSWKADGTRYMMYIQDRGAVFLIRRDAKVFPISEITFPSRKGNDTNHVKETLLDCEMVLETKQNNVERAYLLIYDVVAFGGDPQFGQLPHSERMKILKCDIYKPREDAAIRQDIDKRREPFSIRLKEFFPLVDTGYIYKNYIPKLQHGNDGLILSRENEGYIPGRCDTLLKWKPPALNSIDFRLKIENVEAREGLLAEKTYNLMVLKDGRKDEMSFIKLDPRDMKKDGFNPLEFDNKIIECTYIKVENRFKILRQRTDKTQPNTYSTAQNVWESICNPLEIDDLLECIQKESFSARLGHKPHQNVGKSTANIHQQNHIQPQNLKRRNSSQDFDSNQIEISSEPNRKRSKLSI